MTRSRSASEEKIQNYTPYDQWVRRLYMTNLYHPVKLGLDNMHALYQALGRPMDNITVLHIAGTNGKGSVVYKLAHTLQLLLNQNNNHKNDDDDDAEPIKIGQFVSPHISSFRERMQVNGQCITEDQVVELLPSIYEACVQHDIPATFFEITTALAMMYFRQEGTRIVVLETGLGGRLDATNILGSDCIALAVITSIGLEHTRILGDTIELIAKEKGGIIKPNRPVLVGPNVPHDVLRQCAQDKHASAYYVSNQVIPEPILPPLKHQNAMGTTATTAATVPSTTNSLSLIDYDLENTQIAQAALQLLSTLQPNILSPKELLRTDLVAQGTSVRPPCRFEEVILPAAAASSASSSLSDHQPITVILDVAHNPPAMEYLVHKLHSTYGSPQPPPLNDTTLATTTPTTMTNYRIIVGMSSDKDLRLCGQAALEVVNGDATRIHLVEAANPRAAKLEDILQANAVAASSTKGGEEEKAAPEELLQQQQQGADSGEGEEEDLGLLASCHYNLNDRSVTYQIQHSLSLMQNKTPSKGDDKNNDSNNNTREILVICGSVFLMAEAREALGFEEPRDSQYIAQVSGAGTRHGQENFGNSGGISTLPLRATDDNNIASTTTTPLK